MLNLLYPQWYCKEIELRLQAILQANAHFRMLAQESSDKLRNS